MIDIDTSCNQKQALMFSYTELGFDAVETEQFQQNYNNTLITPLH